MPLLFRATVKRFALPLGSTVKQDSPYHFSLDFNGRSGSVLLSQGRTFSSKRLSNRMGTLPDEKFEQIRQTYKRIL